MFNAIPDFFLREFVIYFCFFTFLFSLFWEWIVIFSCSLWDLGQQRCVHSYAVHTDSVWALASTPTFSHVYSGGRDLSVSYHIPKSNTRLPFVFCLLQHFLVWHLTCLSSLSMILDFVAVIPDRLGYKRESFALYEGTPYPADGIARW